MTNGHFLRKFSGKERPLGVAAVAASEVALCFFTRKSAMLSGAYE